MTTSIDELLHQKAEDGNGKLARGLEPHFPAPASTEAWHYLTQLNQVRAVRTGIEHWRSYWPHTAGTIVWQLNDLWPVTSWAAIDGACLGGGCEMAISCDWRVIFARTKR